MELYRRKGSSGLSFSDIGVSVFPLWLSLVYEIPFLSDLLLLLFNHPFIFQVRKELLEHLDPKVCRSIKYLLWIFYLGSFRYEYFPWELTLPFFGLLFCVFVRKQTVFLWWKHFTMKQSHRILSLFVLQVTRVRKVLVEWQVSGLFSWSSSLSNIHMHYLNFQIADSPVNPS